MDNIIQLFAPSPSDWKDIPDKRANVVKFRKPYDITTPGTVLYASQDTPDALTEAKEYIAQQGLTRDQVALIRVGDMIMVRVK